MPPFGGRHELGQNFLVDPHVRRRLVDLLPRRPDPVLELGAGDGAVTRLLAAGDRPVTAVELDPRRAAALRRELAGRARVEHADMLRFALDGAHDIVSNVPFSVTTPLLRHLLAQRTWGTAVLLLQWEVARKRAAVGGTTLLTASWWPWYEFALAGRVPAGSFRPVPSVDGGLLVVRRRAEPLLPERQRGAYQRRVREAFDRGRVGARRPRDLDAAQWAAAFLHPRCRRR